MLAPLMPAIATGLVALLAAGALWYTLARTILYERDIHTLTVETHRLQIDYAQRLARMQGNEAWGDAELVLDEREEAILAKFGSETGEEPGGEQSEAPTAQAA